MIQAGDILYSSWGYDQTNVDWYKVTARKGKRVYLQPLPGIITESKPLAMYGHSVPGESTGAPVFYRQVKEQIWNGENRGEYVKIKSYAYAHLWDGHPRPCTWYG